jgi:hypothetical protein
MAYQLIPNASDRIDQSQAQLKENFTQIKTLIDVNHVTFGAAGQGKHALVTFPNLAAPAAPAGNDINIYNATVGGNPELNIYKTGGSAIPFTQSGQAGTSGWTYLPSGMKIIWGRATLTNPATTAPVLFSSVAGFPGFTNTPGITLVRMDSATTTNFMILDTATPPSNLGFSARRSPNSLGDPALFSWLAVGA